MANANIKAVVTAEDKASPVINNVANSTNKLGKSIKEADSRAASAGSSFRGLGTSVGTTIAAYQVLSTTLKKTVGFFGDSIKAATEYQGAFIGLASVAGGFGQSVQGATGFVKKFTQDGLVAPADAARALKNLLSSGFGLPEAEQLMESFKNKAVFNRQAWYSIGGAVAATAEGIKTGNSVMADATGTTTNLSMMAKQAGVSIDEMGNIQQSAALRTAYMNGFLSDAATSMGNAAIYANTFGGAQAKAGVQAYLLKTNVGALVQSLGGPLLQVFANFIQKNGEMVSRLAVASAGAIVFATAAFGIVKVGSIVVQTLLTMSTAMTIFSVATMAVALVIGVVLYKAFNKVQGSINQQNQGLIDQAGNAKKSTQQTQQLGGAQDDLGKKIAKVNQQIELENRSYKESLTEMVRSHQDKVRQLQSGLEEENTSFKESQNDAVADHQERVAKIQEQIQKETNLGILGNQQRLIDLQTELAKEQAEYDKKAAKEQADHDKKMADMQAQLDAETALLQKHSDDVSAIRDVQLLDEIDKLKRSHAEQLISYDEQKKSIVENASQTAQGIVGAFNDQVGGMNTAGTNMGTELVKGIKSAVGSEAKKTGLGIGRFFEATGRTLPKLFGRGDTGGANNKDGSWADMFNQAWEESNLGGDSIRTGNATGTSNWRGGRTWVGEQGPEIVDLPQGSRVTPNNKLGTLGSGGVNITIQAGAFMGTQMEARKYAKMIMDAYNDATSAKEMAL